MGDGVNVTALVVISAGLVVWGLLSARLERASFTAPIAFVLFGLLVSHGPLAIVHLRLHSASVRSLAEVTLALVLFADASRVNATALRSGAEVPARLLGIGLPLCIGAGTVVAAGLFRGAGWWVAAVVGSIVAPTDAALGAELLQDERVPGDVRRVLNVESGLNDGVATPFVNLFLAGALTTEAVHGSGPGQAVLELLGGAALGAAVGLLGAALMGMARRRGWSAPSFRPIAVLALAVFAYALAIQSGTNGFVAAFVSGLAFGSLTPPGADQLAFTEDAGMLLSLLVWFIFGAVMLVPGFEAAGWQDVVFGLLALTALRMLPVAAALLGSGLDRETVAFIGWFGPRGLASVIFALVAVDALAPPEAKTVLGAVTVTVAMSVLAHGATAAPLALRYAKVVEGRRRLPVQSEALRTRSLSGRRHPADRHGQAEAG